jgi:hypothetical protein
LKPEVDGVRKTPNVQKDGFWPEGQKGGPMDPKNRFSLNGQPKSKIHSEDDRRVEVAKTLTQKFDELNQRWTAAETELKTIPLPLDVWVTVETNGEPGCDPKGEIMLGFAKSKGGWRICLGYADYYGPGDVETGTPIVECGHEWRMKAAAVLPELRRKVLQAAAESVTKLDEVLKSFE